MYEEREKRKGGGRGKEEREEEGREEMRRRMERGERRGEHDGACDAFVVKRSNDSKTRGRDNNPPA
jgi:hypothetical protein